MVCFRKMTFLMVKKTDTFFWLKNLLHSICVFKPIYLYSLWKTASMEPIFDTTKVYYYHKIRWIRRRASYDISTNWWNFFAELSSFFYLVVYLTFIYHRNRQMLRFKSIVLLFQNITLIEKNPIQLWAQESKSWWY